MKHDARDARDMLVSLTEWAELGALDLKKPDLRKRVKEMATPRMADLLSIHSARDTRCVGFDAHEGIGR